MAVAFVGEACTATVEREPPPAIPAGAAVMDWTVEETKDPAGCQATGATTFHVSLYGSNGGFAGEWTQDCSAFSTSIGGLVPDTYTGRANLLGPGGGARTTSVALAPFDVIGNASVDVALDFPASSFY